MYPCICIRMRARIYIYIYMIFKYHYMLLYIIKNAILQHPLHYYDSCDDIIYVISTIAMDFYVVLRV